MTIVDTTDGRTINGIVVAENEKGVTIRTTNEDVIVPKDEIAKRPGLPLFDDARGPARRVEA